MISNIPLVIVCQHGLTNIQYLCVRNCSVSLKFLIWAQVSLPQCTVVARKAPIMSPFFGMSPCCLGLFDKVMNVWYSDIVLTIWQLYDCERGEMFLIKQNATNLLTLGDEGTVSMPNFSLSILLRRYICNNILRVWYPPLEINSSIINPKEFLYI